MKLNNVGNDSLLFNVICHSILYTEQLPVSPLYFSFNFFFWNHDLQFQNVSRLLGTDNTHTNTQQTVQMHVIQFINTELTNTDTERFIISIHGMKFNILYKAETNSSSLYKVIFYFGVCLVYTIAATKLKQDVNK